MDRRWNSSLAAPATVRRGGLSSALTTTALFLRRKPLGASGAVVLLLLIVVAVLAPLIATHDPILPERQDILKAPSAQHFFGTDNFGRDIFSRVAYGARISLYVGLVATALGTGIGAALGLASGYAGGLVDTLVQRAVDILFTIPGLVLALVLMAMLSTGAYGPAIGLLVPASLAILALVLAATTVSHSPVAAVLLGSVLLSMAALTALFPATNNIVIAIAIPWVPGTSRVVRSAVLSVKEHQYIEAARAIGSGPQHVVFRHVVPNIAAPYTVIATAQLGSAILIEAALSFLGMGVSVSAPSWGRMLSVEGMRFFETAPWMALFPGLAISVAVFSANLFGDALRDLLDPRLRGY